jgi:hypothetical protein
MGWPDTGNGCSSVETPLVKTWLQVFGRPILEEPGGSVKRNEKILSKAKQPGIQRAILKIVI